MSGVLGVLTRQNAVDSGAYVAGAKLFVYDATTTTKRAIYTTSALSVQHANPLVADSNGRFAAFYVNPTGGAYKLVLTTSGDTDPPASPLWTDDSIPVEVPDDALSSNVPLLDANNTFLNASSGNAQFIQGEGQAGLYLYDTAGTSGARRVSILVDDNTHFYIQALTDAGASTENLIDAVMNGSSQWTSLALAADAITVNGNSAATLIEGSFTGTLTGMSGATTGTVNYKVVANSAGTGKLCTLYAANAIQGTSNTTAMTMTGLPAACVPTVAIGVLCTVADNSASFVFALAQISASGTTITFSVDQPFSSTGFTGSGTKGLDAGWQMTYVL